MSFGECLQSGVLRQRLLPFLVEIAVAGVMIAALIEAQVVGSVVGAFAVAVMHGFVVVERTPDLARHDDVVLEHPVAAFRHDVEPVLEIRRDAIAANNDVTLSTENLSPRFVSLLVLRGLALATPRGEHSASQIHLNHARNFPADESAFRAGDFHVRDPIAAATRGQHLRLGVIDTVDGLVRAESGTNQVSAFRAATTESSFSNAFRDGARSGRSHMTALWTGDLDASIGRYADRGGPVNLRMRRTRINDHDGVNVS